jgi:hypothetical protein
MMSEGPPEVSTRELETTGGGEGISNTSEVDGATEDGDCSLALLVPAALLLSLSSGKGATVVCWSSVVVVDGSCSVVLTKRSGDVEASCERMRESKRDVKSGVSRVSMSDELLEEDGVDEEVGTAGAVAFVKIWRLTCRGK